MTDQDLLAFMKLFGSYFSLAELNFSQGQLIMCAELVGSLLRQLDDNPETKTLPVSQAHEALHNLIESRRALGRARKVIKRTLSLVAKASVRTDFLQALDTYLRSEPFVKDDEANANCKAGGILALFKLYDQRLAGLHNVVQKEFTQQEKHEQILRAFSGKEHQELLVVYGDTLHSLRTRWLQLTGMHTVALTRARQLSLS